MTVAGLKALGFNRGLAQDSIISLVKLKDRLMRVGLIRTMHKVDEALYEAGYELAEYGKVLDAACEPSKSTAEGSHRP